MTPFELITEHGRPVAAIIQGEVGRDRLFEVYALIAAEAMNHPQLAERWGVYRVLATSDWSRAQLRRVPMTRPKQTIKLAFL